MPSNWYIRDADQQVEGPFEEPEIRARLLAGAFSSGAEVRQGKSQWMPADNIKQRFVEIYESGWYVKTGEKTVGPFVAGKITELHQTGKLPKNAFLRQGTNKEWKPAAEVIEEVVQKERFKEQLAKIAKQKPDADQEEDKSSSAQTATNVRNTAKLRSTSQDLKPNNKTSQGNDQNNAAPIEVASEVAEVIEVQPTEINGVIEVEPMEAVEVQPIEVTAVVADQPAETNFDWAGAAAAAQSAPISTHSPPAPVQTYQPPPSASLGAPLPKRRSSGNGAKAVKGILIGCGTLSALGVLVVLGLVGVGMMIGNTRQSTTTISLQGYTAEAPGVAAGNKSQAGINSRGVLHRPTNSEFSISTKVVAVGGQEFELDDVISGMTRTHPLIRISDVSDVSRSNLSGKRFSMKAPTIKAPLGIWSTNEMFKISNSTILLMTYVSGPDKGDARSSSANHSPEKTEELDAPEAFFASLKDNRSARIPMTQKTRNTSSQLTEPAEAKALIAWRLSAKFHCVTFPTPGRLNVRSHAGCQCLAQG